MTSSSDLTIREARAEATRQLGAAGVDTASLDARVLLAHVLEESQTGLFMRDLEAITVKDLERYRALVQQRSTGMPVAYLTEQREFMGLQFHTAPGVLVPRPDTEPLVEWGLEWLKSHPEAQVADIGTGSGAIAIAVVHHAPAGWAGSLVATDISEEALAIATANADSVLSTERRARIRFERGNLTEPLKQPVDLLLTNLPYLTPTQIAENPDLAHEPQLALDGGADGLDLMRHVIDELPQVLSQGGAAGFEIDPSQSAEVQRLLRMRLPNHRVEVVADLAGDERHIVAH